MYILVGGQLWKMRMKPHDQSEQRFRRLLEAAPDAMVVVNTPGEIVLVNSQAEKMFGYIREELIGQSIEMLIPERFWGSHEAHRRRYMGKPYIRPMSDGFEFYARSKEGREFPVEINLSPLETEEGVLIISAIRDMTDRKRLEEMLRQQAQVFENIYDSVILTDQAGRIIDCNPATEKLFGYAKEELLGQPPRIWHRPAESAELTAEIIEGLKEHDRWSGQINFIRKDGRAGVCEVVVVPVYDEHGQQVATIGVSRDITRQTQEEEALRQQRAFLRQVIDLSPNFIYARDRQGRFTLVNQTGANYYQTSVEELLGKTDADFMADPAEAAAILKEDLNIMDSLKDFGPELRQITVQGEGRWLQVIKRPLVDEHGVANQVLGIAMDITALKHTEEILRESERKYRSVVDNVKEIIFQVDPAGLWTFLNPAWTEITGFSIEESLGTNFLDYIQLEDRPRVTELYQILLQGEIDYYWHMPDIVTKTGGLRWLEIYAHPTLADDGTITGMAGTLNDITDRRRAEQALLASETRFRTLATHAPVGIFQTDAQGECIFVNKRWVEISGTPSVQALGRGWTKALHPDDREAALAEWETAARSGREFSLEYRFQTLDGRVTWVLGKATPLRDEKGEIGGYLGTVMDISERKRTELLEKDRNGVLEMISQNKPLKLVLNALIQLVERQHPELLGSVLLLRDGRVYHGAAPNLPESFTQMVDGLALSAILKTRDMAAYRGETLIVNNMADEPDPDGYRELALQHHLQAYWSAPIFSSDGALLGIFTSYYRQPNKPTPEERHLVRMASRLAAIAIEHYQLTEQLAYQAQHDALTGLSNRPLFEDRLQQAIAHARRNDYLVGLLYLDLDQFKQVNDSLGHTAGDALLRQVTERLQGCLREEDTLARLGGDEFAAVLPGLESPHAAVMIAEQILEITTAPFTIRGQDVRVTTSIGISLYPTDSHKADELLSMADNALYRCKQQGKNSYQFYTPAVNEMVHRQHPVR
jgi:diguanylate cyclase (GGDEF)-like protein/PAS domain S-box-containing protein